MHFPKYWAKGESTSEARWRNPATGALDGRFACWGWSDVSLDEARAKGQQRADAVLERVRINKRPDHYLYGDRPLREEVLREFRTPEGTLRAAITRNSYGCLVLNTADLMFVDVDAPAPQPTGFMERLFGVRREEREQQAEIFYNGVLARVNDWVGRWQGWGWRVYRTAAGVRLLATHEPFAPGHTMCETAFEVFEADPLYRKLCATQKCFRARLTPKPWRCDMDKPRGGWPWANEKTEARFRKWEVEYTKAAERYATCKLLGQFGSQDFHPSLRELVALHDQATRAESGLPLA